MLRPRRREWRARRCAAANEGLSRGRRRRLGPARIAPFDRRDQAGPRRRRRAVFVHARQARPLSRPRRASGAWRHDRLVSELHTSGDLGGAVGFYDRLSGKRRRRLGRVRRQPGGSALSDPRDARRRRRLRQAARSRGALPVDRVARKVPEDMMARDGYRIFDSDTHVGPDAAILARYLSAADTGRLAAWEPYRAAGRNGHITYNKGQRHYRRRLGDARPDEAPSGYMAGFTGVARERDPSPKVDADPAARIADMDYEGVDVNLTLPSGWFGTWTAGDDVVLELAMYRAYHRWMSDYCGAFPRRLGGVILAGARDIDGALGEIRRWGNSAWAWGMMVYAPVGMPLDHPMLEPLYAEAAALDLAVVLHTFTVMPPYAPGGQDTWDNLWLQRSAAHPWCGMRNMASLIGSGVMDRYPDLRIATLEAGHGWLPFWIKRLDEHAETIKAALPELRRRPSDYVTC